MSESESKLIAELEILHQLRRAEITEGQVMQRLGFSRLYLREEMEFRFGPKWRDFADFLEAPMSNHDKVDTILLRAIGLQPSVYTIKLGGFSYVRWGLVQRDIRAVVEDNSKYEKITNLLIEAATESKLYQVRDAILELLKEGGDKK